MEQDDKKPTKESNDEKEETTEETDPSAQYVDLPEDDDVRDVFFQLYQKFIDDPADTIAWLLNDIDRLKQYYENGLKKVEATQAIVKDLENQEVQADIIFKSLRTQHLRQKAVMEQTARILDHFNLSTDGDNTTAELDDPNITIFLWERLKEWRTLLFATAWMRRRQRRLNEIDVAQATVNSIIQTLNDVGENSCQFEELNNADDDEETEKLRERIRQLQEIHSQYFSSDDPPEDDPWACSEPSSSKMPLRFPKRKRGKDGDQNKKGDSAD